MASSRTAGGRSRLTNRQRLLVTSIVPGLFRALRIPFAASALPTHFQSLLSSSSAPSIINSRRLTAEAANLDSLLRIMAEEPETPVGSPAFFMKLAVVLCLVLIGGILAGLTLALMSMDTVNLTVMEQSGDGVERKRAAKVLRLLKRGHHWVLVTLLLFNTITNETLPIFLDDILGGGFYAIASSTALILLFGEIIPQAICSRYGLAIGAASVPFMTIIMYASYPISYPIALLLDRVLGHDEGVTYKKKELKTFVSLHRHLGAENLVDDEVTIISAVLELSEKSIRDIMVPIEDIYSISSHQILDDDTVGEILRQGYSRVPVYEGNNTKNFIGMLLVKNLITYDPEDAKPVSSFNLIPLPEAELGMSCLEALNFFATFSTERDHSQQGRSHMMLVTEHPGETTGALGIVSLEDVIEELIGEEIIDETDLFLDVANKIKVVRRPIIRTGAAKKLTPLLRDVAEKRRNKVNSPMINSGNDPAGGKTSRTGSESEGGDARSENDGERPPDSSGNPTDRLLVSRKNTLSYLGHANYGATLQAATTAGVSTPRRRPSNQSRLSDIGALGPGLAGLSLDQVKVKGGTSAQRKDALHQVKNSLESGSNGLPEFVDEGSQDVNSASASLSASPSPMHDGSAVTIIASLAPTAPAQNGNGKRNSEPDGYDSDHGEFDRSEAARRAGRRLQAANELDENAPLLGGKQVVDGSQ